MKEFIDAFKKYAEFSGKSTRKEFWMFVLVYLIINIVISILQIDILAGLFWLVTLIPGLAITVRRLRDANFNVWWVLVSLVPVLGAIVLIIMCAQPSKVPNVAQAQDVSGASTAPSSPQESSTSSMEGDQNGQNSGQ